jgi:mersacidin/lichenicidin family type 2 lantibiotic
MMKKEKILRAWRDPEFRESLTAEELTLLPEHPASAIELRDEQLTVAVGGLASVSPIDVSDTVGTSNTPGTGKTCCLCCAVASDGQVLFG